jgi:peptide deformylase
VRGRVPRPLTIHIEHQDVDGRRRIRIFEKGLARLAAHEIDHLHSVLYASVQRHLLGIGRSSTV